MEETAERRTRQLSDPRALRALAHPLRLRMVAFLNTEGPATATRLAAEFGTSTASTSYHLSQLAKHGLIEPALEEAVGRQRPWRSVGSIRSSNVGSPAFTAAARLLREHSLDLWLQIVDDFLAREDAEDPQWREASFMMDEVGWLTLSELTDLSNELIDLLSRYRRDEVTERPVGARRVAFFAHGLPMRESGTAAVSPTQGRAQRRKK